MPQWCAARVTGAPTYAASSRWRVTRARSGWRRRCYGRRSCAPGRMPFSRRRERCRNDGRQMLAMGLCAVLGMTMWAAAATVPLGAAAATVPLRGHAPVPPSPGAAVPPDIAETAPPGAAAPGPALQAPGAGQPPTRGPAPDLHGPDTAGRRSVTVPRPGGRAHAHLAAERRQCGVRAANPGRSARRGHRHRVRAGRCAPSRGRGHGRGRFRPEQRAPSRAGCRRRCGRWRPGHLPRVGTVRDRGSQDRLLRLAGGAGAGLAGGGSHSAEQRRARQEALLEAHLRFRLVRTTTAALEELQQAIADLSGQLVNDEATADQLMQELGELQEQFAELQEGLAELQEEHAELQELLGGR